MKTWILIGMGALVVLIGTFLVVKKVSPLSWNLWGVYNTSSGIALKGYDPVAYFNGSGPAQGDSQFAHDWGGVTWHFSDAENRNLFSANPDNYVPQFGGFCSFAVSKGFTADISPDAWHIKNGKLFVFADKNVRDDWVARIDDGSLENSTTNWQKR